MSYNTITSKQLNEALSIRDLTDPGQGHHAIQLLLKNILNSLSSLWPEAEIKECRGDRVVSVQDNYDRLLYPKTGIARESRYTRYWSDKELLRTQMSAIVPSQLDKLVSKRKMDVLLLCPGIVYRRDVIDRLHVGEPHQLDLWRVRSNLTENDLEEMIEQVVNSLLPGSEWKTEESSHHYTLKGREILVKTKGEWIEIGECGLAHPQVLKGAGLTSMTGLAMGIGLDRALMINKGVDDIRLLRSEDPRVKRQMNDLEKYMHVSDQPAAMRDISVAHKKGKNDEEIGDIVRESLGEKVEWLESMEIIERYDYEETPLQAVKRLGLEPEQENLLIRLTLRHPVHSLPKKEANKIIDSIYLSLHQGSNKGYGPQ